MQEGPVGQNPAGSFCVAYAKHAGMQEPCGFAVNWGAEHVAIDGRPQGGIASK
jgi:hypothetical protein